MPDSLEFFEFKLNEAKKYHQSLKDNPQLRSHSMSLQYANKAVKDLEDKVFLAIKLWGDEEDIKQIEREKKEAAQSKAAKSKTKNDIIERHNGFFAFNTEQFLESYNKLKGEGIVLEGEKNMHVGYGLYIPKNNVDNFLIEYKSK